MGRWSFVHALAVEALVGVIALLVLNAIRGDRSLVVGGAVATAVISLGLAMLRARSRR